MLLKILPNGSAVLRSFLWKLYFREGILQNRRTDVAKSASLLSLHRLGIAEGGDFLAPNFN
ncbi:hypothetical protein D1Y74_10210 [Riemerella anatipestifer]|nr:hypothetical protein [Riemerella anatipestifer]